MSSMTSALMAQFGRPHGLLGYLISLTMAVENRRRNRWVVEQLGITSGQHVLEVGCGAGVGVARAAALVGSGQVFGVDVSDEAISVARWLNRKAIAAKRVELRRADAAALPYPAGHFDVVWAVNTLHHWSEPERGLGEMLRVLRGSGTFAVAEQPRHETSPTAREDVSERLAGRLRRLGFADIRTMRLDAKPAPVFVVIGTGHGGSWLEQKQ